MNTLHPVMAQALAPHTFGLIGKPYSLTPPRCPAGQVEFLYLLQGPNEVVTCHLEYEPAECGLHERGVQVERDWPAIAHLTAAYHRGGDVLRLMSAEQVEEIEAMALREVSV